MESSKSDAKYGINSIASNLKEISAAKGSISNDSRFYDKIGIAIS